MQFIWYRCQVRCREIDVMEIINHYTGQRLGCRIAVIYQEDLQWTIQPQIHALTFTLQIWWILLMKAALMIYQRGKWTSWSELLFGLTLRTCSFISVWEEPDSVETTNNNLKTVLICNTWEDMLSYFSSLKGSFREYLQTWWPILVKFKTPDMVKAQL